MPPFAPANLWKNPWEKKGLIQKETYLLFIKLLTFINLFVLAFSMGLAEKSDYLMGHILWGSLPEQEFWEKHLSGYDSKTGVNASALAEILVCGVFASVHPDYSIFATLDVLLASTRINMSGRRRGMYALEAPYQALKFVGQAVASHVSRRKDYL